MSSEITRMRQQIDQEQEAASRGLLGPAIVARHAFIESRLTHQANHILQLIEQHRLSEATLLMEHASWGDDDTPPVVTIPEDEPGEDDLRLDKERKLMNLTLDPDTLFQQARTLLVSAYRQSSVVVRQADVPLDATRYFTSHGNDLAALCQHHAVVSTLLFLLTDAGHGGQPFADLLPFLPASLAHGELRRIYWHEQPIAISLHPDPLPPELWFSQRVAALLAWSSQHQHASAGLWVRQEASQHISMRDPLPLTALTRDGSRSA